MGKGVVPVATPSTRRVLRCTSRTMWSATRSPASRGPGTMMTSATPRPHHRRADRGDGVIGVEEAEARRQVDRVEEGGIRSPRIEFGAHAVYKRCLQTRHSAADDYLLDIKRKHQ